MAIRLTGNFDYRGKQALEVRAQYATLAEMKAFDEADLNEGLIAYNLETKKHYVFRSTHEVNETTGKWKELNAEADKQFTAEEVNDLKSRFANKSQFKIHNFAVGATEGGSEHALTANVVTEGVDIVAGSAQEESIVTILDKAGAEKILGVTNLKETIDEINTNAAKTVEVESQGLVHTIKYGGQTVGTINIPKDTFVSAFTYDAENKKLKVTVGDNTLEVPVADFVQDYTAGTGLSLEGNQFSIEAGLKANIDKIPTLETKVTNLEARPNYELGYQASGRKFPVAQEGNKLYVEVPAQETTLNQRTFIVTEAEFKQKKDANQLVADAIYFIKEA